MQVRQDPGGGGLPVGAGDGDDGDPWLREVRSRPGLRVENGQGGLGDQLVDRMSPEPVHDGDDGQGERLRAPPVPPGEGQHQVVHVAARPGTYREPGRAGRPGHAPGDVRQEAEREPLALTGPRSAGM